MDWNRLLSRTRIGTIADQGIDQSRSDFQRDFDRIVFSAAFRRLQDKTQVFPLAQSDYVRTRLTHSLEVASVGRSLGSKVGDAIIRRYDLHHIHPQDVGAIIAAACLAHDLGNPPFGHAGEDAIRLWFQTSAAGQAVIEALSPAEREDFLRFEGNAQGFRLVARLQSPDNRGGMQLTCATLGAASKYPRASWLKQKPPQDKSVGFRKFGFFQDDFPLFAEVAGQLGLRSAGEAAWYRHPLAYLVEAADDICYRIVDLEDAYRLRLLGYDEVAALLVPLLDGTRDLQRLEAIRHANQRIEFLRAKAIGALVEQVAACFMAHETAILQGDFSRELIGLIPASRELQALLDTAEAEVYVAAQVVEVGAAGFRVLGGLLEAFVNAVNDVAERGAFASPQSRMLLRLLPEPFLGPRHQPAPELYRRVLAITDFVSAMTDSYAVTLYKKITGISLSV